jgi:hypothetical protein
MKKLVSFPWSRLPLVSTTTLLLSDLTLFGLKGARAAEFEPQGQALMALLQSKKVSKKTVDVAGGPMTVFFTKDEAGRPARAAFVEKGVYEPNCSHTWAIGLDAKAGAIEEIRVIEMECNHAFPTRAASFLDQFKGRKVADAPKLSSQIRTVAKATGSCDLTTDAVKRVLTAWPEIQKKL